MSLQIKSAKFIVWKGEQRNYEFWRPKFLLNCKLKGSMKGFLQEESDLPTEGKTTEEIAAFKKEKEKYEENNTKSLSELVFSIDHEKEEGTKALGYAMEAKTPMFPEGDAREALLQLDKRYATKDIEDQEVLQNKYESATTQAISYKIWEF